MHNIPKRAKIFIGLLTIFGLLLISLFFLGNISFAKDQEGSDDFVADEVIVQFKGDSKPFRVVKLPAGKSVKEAAQEFERSPQVEYAEPNYIARAFFIPNDPYYPLQWHLQNPVYGGINMEAAWNVSNGTGVVVAVVDTGAAYENFDVYRLAPDLAGTAFVPGYDFVNNDTHPNDDNGHGTHVAGTVAQSTNNALGVAGVAFGASIMPVKVLDKNGMGTYANVANGIIWAANNGAKVINLSLGGSAPSLTLENAVAYAYNNGVTIVAAAGNDALPSVSYPAAYDVYVIAVGATRYDETLAYYSNYGPSIDLVAPGGDLRIDQNGDGYGDGVLQQTFGRRPSQFGYYFSQGTSMAAPHVAGTAALAIAKGIVGPVAVRSALQNSAEDLGTPGWDATYGWGLVNATAALGPIDTPPTVSITSPLSGATVSGLVTISATATDDVGVTQVNFYVDAVLLGSDLVAPYSWNWDSTTVLDGTRTLTARAIDTIGQTGSNAVSVLVDNVNDLPVANAGPDQTVVDANGDGVELVTLNGSTSYDPDGTLVSYEWKEGTVLLGTGAIVTVNFAVGTHTVTLTVTDNRGASASDSVVMTVQPKPAVNVAVTKFDARDINLGGTYNIQAQVANLASVPVTITLRVRVYDSTGTTLIDGTLPDKTVNLAANGTAKARWNNPSPLSAGAYLAVMTVLENPALQASDPFSVLSVSGGAADD